MRCRNCGGLILHDGGRWIHLNRGPSDYVIACDPTQYWEDIPASSCAEPISESENVFNILQNYDKTSQSQSG